VTILDVDELTEKNAGYGLKWDEKEKEKQV
jgi:hypothetical protein